MFLDRFGPAQRVAFVRLAQLVVVADGGAAAGEVLQLARLRRQLGLELDTALGPLSVEAAASHFTSAADQRTALLELTVLASADRRRSPFEDSLLGRLAATWSIDPVSVRSLEAWVVRYRELEEEGLRLIAGGSSFGGTS